MTVISLATVASLVDNEGLGVPIFDAISKNVFKTELISAGVLAVLLALVADALLVAAAASADPLGEEPSGLMHNFVEAFQFVGQQRPARRGSPGSRRSCT